MNVYLSHKSSYIFVRWIFILGQVCTDVNFMCYVKYVLVFTMWDHVGHISALALNVIHWIPLDVF